MSRFSTPVLLIGLVLFIGSCAVQKNTKLAANGLIEIKEVATDASYGSEKNPIMVGGVADSQGPANEHAYLNLLAGPNGEKISYIRLGSCCAFKTERGFLGEGLLDIYQVSWEGQDQPVKLYINMYDYQKLFAPVGFTIR